MKTGATAGQRRRPPWSRAWSAAPRPATRWASSACPIPTGAFRGGAVLRRPRDSTATCWSRARAVLLQLGAELQGEDVRARACMHAEPLDHAAAKTQKGLRIFLRDAKPLDSIARAPRHAGGGACRPAPARRRSRRRSAAASRQADGDVTLVMMLDLETEVEMKLPGRSGGLAADRGRHQGGRRRRRRADAGTSPIRRRFGQISRRLSAGRCSCRPYFLASGARSALYTAPSHTGTMAQKGRPVAAGPSKARSRLLTRFPEEPTGELNQWRFLISSCVSCLKLAFTLATRPTAGIRRWQDYIFGARNNIHIIDLAQTVPMLHTRAAGGQRHRRQGRPHPVRRHQALRRRTASPTLPSVRRSTSSIRAGSAAR